MQGRVSRSWRRTFIATVAALLVSGTIAGPIAAEPTNPRAVANLSAEITLMSTTDVHCRVLNWDYFKNAPYSSGQGLARISTLVNEVRAERGRDSTLLFDIGDTIQGTPLCTYYNVNDPITNGGPDPLSLIHI